MHFVLSNAAMAPDVTACAEIARVHVSLPCTPAGTHVAFHKNTKQHQRTEAPDTMPLKTATPLPFIPFIPFIPRASLHPQAQKHRQQHG